METLEKLYTLPELLESEESEEITGHLYSRELEAVEAILELNYWKYDSEKKEDLYTLDDLEQAVDDLDNKTYWNDWDAYYDYCDELLSFSNPDSVEARYFDYDAYHRDCEYDVSEASNGVIIADW